ncbi:MAG: hypothetical protein QG657_2491 [Acidobacteriota bacterium]|nr:hypothetical protein [Acidobacteriota bacterium]
MADDMEIIRQIEKQTGKLRLVRLSHTISYSNSYALDNTGQVVGLNLDGRRLKDISF